MTSAARRRLGPSVAAMLRNYLKTALRTLRKQKLYAFINVAGLAVGLAFCVLIFLYVHHELTYDRFHAEADRIHRVLRVSYTADGGTDAQDPMQPMPLGPAMQRDLPAVEQYVRFFEWQNFIRRGDTTFEEETLFADASVLEVFSFPLVHGNPATALDNPNSIVLSADAARKYFGEANPMGETIAVRLEDGFQDFVVTGVAENVPSNSSIRFDYLLPFAKLPQGYEWLQSRVGNWRASSFATYVLLDNQASVDDLRSQLPDFRATYYPNEAERRRAEGRWTGDGPPIGYRLQPLPEIHLDPSVRGGLTPASDPQYSYILAAIALAILLMACINFTTLAIGRSAQRAQEVGVRKAVGAKQRQVMGQFWGEALLLSGLALGVGLILVELFLPTFSTLAAKDLHFDYRDSGLTMAVLVGLTLLTGLVAGSYPAVVLSGVRPIETLRQRVHLGGASTLTQTLVVVQFALSVFLVIGTFVMMRQLHYVQSKNLGFDREHVVVIETNGVDGTQALQRYRTALGTHSDIWSIAGTSISFARGWGRVGFEYEGEPKSVYEYRVTPNYVDVLGMEIVAGRNFNPDRATDRERGVIVNEALVHDFGWTDPIGQPLTGYTDNPADDPVVIGVVKDYHFRSLRREVAPMLLTIDPDQSLRFLLARIAPGDVSGTLDQLRATWQEISADLPFQYSFLDDDIDALYESEQRWSRIVSYAAGFAVVIACLGLFGLATLAATARTKEIGIRKALGASMAGIVALLSKDFARLVLLGIGVAAPVAYLAMQHWLDTFAYRVGLGPWVFVGAGGLALAVALGTVSVQALRAARIDPAQTLRSE